MLQFNWQFKFIANENDMDEMVTLFKAHPPECAAAFDTETTGLHIILDKPFIIQFGWVCEKNKTGYVFIVDLQNEITNRTMKLWHVLISKVPHYLGHNVKFDMHMLTNVHLFSTNLNYDDTQFYIRLGTDAVQVKDGGAPLSLKDFAAQYLDPNAKYHEKLLRQERSDIAKGYNTILINKLNALGDHKWNHSTLKKIFIKDIITRDLILTDKEKEVWEDWKQNDLPLYLKDTYKVLEADDIRYDTLNRELVLRYAYYDIVYTLEIFYALKDIVHTRGNDIGIAYERRIILPLYEMERVGFKIDVPYLTQAEKDMKEYIIATEELLHEKCGKDISVGQHSEIKKIISERLGYTINSSRREVLLQLRTQLIRDNEHPDVVELIDIIDELRTLEKWYSTYVLRFIKDLKRTDRLYTQIQQVGTVSGRVTSDFQQFPKKGIQTRDGKPLFNPRQAVTIEGVEGYDGIVYLDYSQIELRFQALYTILVGHPDLNLCRAYMPYECYYMDGDNKILFDFKNPEHIKMAYTQQWLRNENGEPWVPTDVHGATTKAAFGIDETHPDFHDLRYIGKRVNFAKNYGAQYGKISEMFPEYPEETVKKIDEAYYKAFPGVKEYHNYCYTLAKSQPYATNLFGVKYWGVSGHKLINMLVQGSAAYFLKWKIYQIYQYTKENNIQSKFQMNIHDELSWEKAENETTIFTDFQNIMQTWEDGYVPIIADMEITHTTWADKVEVKQID